MAKRKIDPDTQAQIDSWEKPIPKGKGPGHPKMREKRPVKRVGRPPGQRAAQLELQEFMYKHPKKLEVVKKLFDGALDDDHKNQAAFMKIVMDRMLPVSGFEKMGGKVVYFGKPYPEVYNLSINNKGKKILSVGDNLNTDIKGANLLNYDSLIISNGIHKNEIKEKGIEATAKSYETICNYIQSDLKW